MRSDILICAVGGQNVKPFYEFIRSYAKEKGVSFRVNVEKGFSREKCVEKYSLRLGGGFGDITEGSADVVIALEQLEGVRFRTYAKEDGAMLVSEKRIMPISVLSHVATYPENAFQKCINDCFRVYSFEESDYLFACLTALRLSGESKEELNEFGIKSGLYTKEKVEKVFAAKPVKA